ncbi:MAG TPA: choice-of-anchor J domain-containing protein [Gaiellaceae bacterium]|nr:choice-of-anchor J domain-containing protein [Gaiellaceae bacterium]
MRRFSLALAAIACLALVMTSTGLAASRTAKAKKAKAGARIANVGPDYNQGKPLPFRGASKLRNRAGAQGAQGRRALAAGETPPVGTQRLWFGLDDTAFVIEKTFTLKAVSAHMEAWVADDLLFPAGDCRNGERTVITQADVDYLVNEFETNIHPKESSAFAVPPARDGSVVNEELAAALGLTSEEAAGLLFPGGGEKIVAFIDNVRDDNFYDTDNASGLPYIAGFFFSFFNELADRNIMSVDAFDWIHRTRANPPNNPSTDLCLSSPARPFLYEGVFAHEYQHLLEYYSDVDETIWINEGLADWAQTLTGYVDPSKPITDQDFDSHIQCFLGWGEVLTPANPNPRQGGPENSLTLWGDQTPDDEAEILCDYGAAYSFMELLAGRYGEDFMSFLHRGQANGLAGVQEALDAFHIRKTAQQLVHEWSVAVALDGIIDDGAKLKRGASRKYRVPTLDATINWDNDDAYESPGAPPNGSDYVRLRNAAGNYLSAKRIRSLRFEGVGALPADPIEWTVDSAPPDSGGDAALYSGNGDNFDRAIVHEVTVPAAPATLRFETKYDTELLFDYAFVQVSTDGGETYVSLANANTTTDVDPGVPQAIQDNLPGFNGDSGGWTTETFDLSPYAGQTILLSFRYMTDSSVALPGWWIDNVMVNGTLLSDGSSLDGFQSLTQINPIEVSGFTVQLISYTANHKKASATTLRVKQARDGSFVARVGRERLEDILVHKANTVSAIVTYDEPTEQITKYAPYALKVNGVLQPGGG